MQRFEDLKYDVKFAGSVAYPDPGSGAFWTPRSGIGFFLDSGSDHYFIELKDNFFGLKYFNSVSIDSIFFCTYKKKLSIKVVLKKVILTNMVFTKGVLWFVLTKFVLLKVVRTPEGGTHEGHIHKVRSHKGRTHKGYTLEGCTLKGRTPKFILTSS